MSDHIQRCYFFDFTDNQFLFYQNITKDVRQKNSKNLFIDNLMGTEYQNCYIGNFTKDLYSIIVFFSFFNQDDVPASIPK
jgi:hypothetical protein